MIQYKYKTIIPPSENLGLHVSIPGSHKSLSDHAKHR